MKKLLFSLLLILASCNIFTQKGLMTTSIKQNISPNNSLEGITVIKGITGTVYHLEAKQCDSNPFETADGSVIKSKDNVNKLRWVALSRDLMKDAYRDKLHNKKGQWKGQIQFGDTIQIISDNKELCGNWIVRDVLNKRFSKRIDFMQDKETGFYGKWENITIVKNV